MTLMMTRQPFWLKMPRCTAVIEAGKPATVQFVASELQIKLHKANYTPMPGFQNVTIELVDETLLWW